MPQRSRSLTRLAWLPLLFVIATRGRADDRPAPPPGDRWVARILRGRSAGDRDRRPTVVRRVDRTIRYQNPAPGNPGPPAPSGGGTPPAIAQPGGPEFPETARTVQPESEAPEALTPLILNRALGLDDSPVRVFGWIQNSFTGNADGTPRDRENFGVFPNHLANSWMGNQYYFAIENPLEPTDRVNVGFRFDTLFGNDWEFTKAYGLFDNAFANNHFAGVDLPQLYGDIHLPILTRGGVDVRGGRFYSLTGFESPQAVARPLLSVPYSLNYTPFTFFGMVASWHIHDRLTFSNGTVNGFDRWIDRNYRWGYLGAWNWTSRDEKLNLVLGGVCVPDQLPRFAPRSSPFLPVGVVTPPGLGGLPNPFYRKSWRAYTIGVLTYKWTERLTQALETDHVWDPQNPGFGSGPGPYRPASTHYDSFVNWFLYKFTDKLTGVWRSEVFWDPDGMATGVGDTYHEITLGLNYRPRPWLWVRPEARYDWSQFRHPFDDGTRSSQLTLAFDVIVLF